MKTCKKVLSLLLVAIMIFGLMSTLIGCKKETIDNESTRLVLSTAELDGVFNPFYSSSGADNGIIGMTQIGMLSSDKYGKVAYGEDEACVVLDYEENIWENSDEKRYTTYRFVLKNDLKFSNGSPLTMKDVLFNLYVYLDPAYYGSSTIYSTDIVGLKEYRTQTSNESLQDGFKDRFIAEANERISRLLECFKDVVDSNKNISLTDAQMKEKLGEAAADFGVGYETVVEDYELTKKYFLEELQKDYTTSKGSYQDISFIDKNNGDKKVTLTTDTEAFFYNQGLIRWDDEEYKFIYSLDENSRNMSEEEAIQTVYNKYIPNELNEILMYRSTFYEVQNYFSLVAQQEYFDSITTGKITNISGIKYANMDSAVTVNGKTYEKPVLDETTGAVVSGNEVLEITINDVDPKAIWNFGFTVAPMYYYSTEEVYEDFDYETNFGVVFGSVDFQDKVIKDNNKIGLPVGAGAYKATTRDGNADEVTAATFKADNIVYFERNEYFEFPVTIKYVNFKVVPTNLMLESLFAGEVHMVEPACKTENIEKIADNKGDGFASTDVMTNGFGYIGINAEKIPDIAIRRAIMHAIDTSLAVDYYTGYAKEITRPMTKASWAYPTAADAAGQYYAFDATGATSEQLLINAGYSKNNQGVYNKDGHTCKYIFTIAGDTADHPAYMALKRASEILNQHGFDIEVKTDINALKKLNTGDLTVWAAAWGAGVDPDMYQVYHMDSTAGSTTNWGYRAIKRNSGGKYEYELDIVERLSEKIDAARETLDTTERANIYAEALNMVMDLAVELPTYQRSDLFAYNTNVIDASTLTPAEDLTPYNGPMSRLWDVSLNESGSTGGGNGALLFVIIASVAAVGAGVTVFFVLKKKKNAGNTTNNAYDFEDEDETSEEIDESDNFDDVAEDDASDKKEE